MGSVGVLAAQLVALLGTLGGLAALVTAGAQRRKLTAEAGRSGADAATVLSSAAVALLEPAREQVAYLRAELESARAEIRGLREQVAHLDTQLRAAHGGRQQ